ncbi:MAG TPA: DUF488 domain-containing protein [bacterium]|jgi:uncharacterized protein (DUF488 family)
MKLFTIGFTKKTAEEFFTLLKKSGAVRVVDVRLNNVSQLAGFSKKDDLRYFLRAICKMDYVHMPELAPSHEILDTYKSGKGNWQQWEKDFLSLMSKRKVEQSVSRDVLNNAVLLCSEDTPDHCHRRLVAEYLSKKWGGVEIIHLT